MDESGEIEGSRPSIRSSLDLFSLWNTDISVTSQDYQPLFPINDYKSDDNVPIEFLYPKSFQYYTACAESYLATKIKITKADGSDIDATADVAPGQQFGQQLFSTVHVYINGTCVTYMPQFYTFRSAIEQMLTTSKAYQNSVLSQELFYRDTKLNNFTPSNSGYKIRQDKTSKSKSVELVMRIGEFPFNCIRQLPPGCEIRIRLMRSSPAECLVGASTPTTTSTFPFKIKFEELVLYMKRYTVDLSIIKEHEERLKRNDNRFQYPIYNQSCKLYTLPTGCTNVAEIPFSGRLPTRIVVAMILSKAYNGTTEYDRLGFADFGLNSATISVSGDTRLEKTIKLDPTNKHFLPAYHMLLEGIPNIENGHWMDRDDFSNGAFMLVYQLAPAGPVGFARPLVGQLKLEMTFGTALTEPVQLLVLGKFPSIIQLDDKSNVYVEHSVI